MKKKSLGLLLAVALSFGAVSPAYAQNLEPSTAEDSTNSAVVNPENENDENQESDSDESDEAGEPDVAVIVGSVVGVVALLGLIGGGLFWAVQQRMMALPVLECIDSVSDVGGVDQAPQYVVVEVAESQGDAA